MPKKFYLSASLPTAEGGVSEATLTPNAHLMEYDSRSISRSLLEGGWRTPNTYTNCYAELIHGPAVYLFLVYGLDVDGAATDYDTAFVAYVGMSRNLSQRLSAHPIMREIQDAGRYLQRWFLPTPPEMLRDRERLLIQKYDPPWNIQGRKRGVVLV